MKIDTRMYVIPRSVGKISFHSAAIHRRDATRRGAAGRGWEGEGARQSILKVDRESYWRND